MFESWFHGLLAAAAPVRSSLRGETFKLHCWQKCKRAPLIRRSNEPRGWLHWGFNWRVEVSGLCWLALGWGRGESRWHCLSLRSHHCVSQSMIDREQKSFANSFLLFLWDNTRCWVISAKRRGLKQPELPDFTALNSRTNGNNQWCIVRFGLFSNLEI